MLHLIPLAGGIGKSRPASGWNAWSLLRGYREADLFFYGCCSNWTPTTRRGKMDFFPSPVSPLGVSPKQEGDDRVPLWEPSRTVPDSKIAVRDFFLF
jgi:hypothetical protein